MAVRRVLNEKDADAALSNQARGHLAPNGLPARAALAVLESTGILYANISPVIVTGLAQSATFDAESAGYVFSVNMYGTALGGFLVIFLAHRLAWRPTAAILLLGLICLDLISAFTSQPTLLYGVRFAHGLTSGVLIGVILSVIARMVSPERTLALCIGYQLTLGGVLTFVLTPLLAELGSRIVWLSLVGFALLALALLPLLGPYPQTPTAPPTSTRRGRAAGTLIAPALLALFVFQAGEMAAFSYVIELGLSYDFDAGFTSTAVAISLWIGGPAALLVTWWSIRSGRLLPVSTAVTLTAASVALLLVPAPVAFLLANVGFGIFFGIALSYLMGVASEMDASGRAGTAAGFAGNLGLATGPAVAAALVGDGLFERVLVFAVSAILISALLAAGPARALDRRNRTGRVEW